MTDQLKELRQRLVSAVRESYDKDTLIGAMEAQGIKIAIQKLDEMAETKDEAKHD